MLKLILGLAVLLALPLVASAQTPGSEYRAPCPNVQVDSLAGGYVYYTDLPITGCTVKHHKVLQTTWNAGKWVLIITVPPPPVNVPPIAAFSAACTYLACNFTDASADSDGTIASRAWAFGDGQTSTSANPSHTYQAAGTYTVSLQVTDNAGATASSTNPLTVTMPPVVPPIGAFASTDFENGTSAPFTAPNGLTTGSPTIVIMDDPTGKFGGKVVRFQFTRSMTAATPDVNVPLRFITTTAAGTSYGQTVFIRGHVLIPTPAANMVDAQRKLFYLQRAANDAEAFVVLKSEGVSGSGQKLLVELPKCPTGNALFNAGTIAYDTKTSLELQMTVNSAPGTSDGIIRVWKDGALVLDQPSACPMRSGTAPYTKFLVGQQLQHQFADKTVLFDEFRYWDNLVVSPTRIGQ